MKIVEALEARLAVSCHRMGEVSIGRFELRHHEDAGRSDLQLFNTPQSAREIARRDDAGVYRPLKSAPTLRHGWRLALNGVRELREALDYFYPAMLGSWLGIQEGRLAPVTFRETANRQSGMYAGVKKITDEQADVLAGTFCASDGHCLKTILWRIDRERPLTRLPAEKFALEADQLGLGERSIPLPCLEACNLFVAAARTVVKQAQS